MDTLVVEDLLLKLTNEQIALPLENTNRQIKGVVLLNVEMEGGTHQKRNVMMRILMIMTGAAHHAR